MAKIQKIRAVRSDFHFIPNYSARRNFWYAIRFYTHFFLPLSIYRYNFCVYECMIYTINDTQGTSIFSNEMQGIGPSAILQFYEFIIF
jgi:hypothetical protein